MKKEIPPIFQHHLEAQRGSDQPDEKTSGITFRAVSIGAFLSLFIGDGECVSFSERGHL